MKLKLAAYMKNLRNKTKENDKLSQEAKELKKMLPKKIEKEEKELSVNEDLVKEDENEEENDDNKSNHNSVEL